MFSKVTSLSGPQNFFRCLGGSQEKKSGNLCPNGLQNRSLYGEFITPRRALFKIFVKRSAPND